MMNVLYIILFRISVPLDYGRYLEVICLAEPCNLVSLVDERIWESSGVQI